MVRIKSTSLLLLFPLCSLAATVQEVIRGRGDLSTLNTLTTRFPSLLDSLAASGGTLLAPTNDALSTFLSAAGVSDLSTVTEARALDLLSYHVLPLSLRSSDLSKEGGALADTRLLSSDFANLEGSPNVVYASAFGSTGQERASSGLKIYSGIGTPANVTAPDVAFDDGYLHVIDRVLNFPQNCTKTAEVGSLSTLLGALQSANLTNFVDTTPKFTCFAPTDAAFQAAGIDIKALSTDQLTDALKYHSIVGDVGYSTAFEDGKEYQTLLGVPVTIHKREGQLFVNDVAVAQGNVIMNNGVAHVLNGVLSPPTTTSTTTGPSLSRTTVTAPTGSQTGSSSAGILSFDHGFAQVLASAFVTLTSAFFL